MSILRMYGPTLRRRVDLYATRYYHAGWISLSDLNSNVMSHVGEGNGRFLPRCIAAFIVN